MNIKTTAVFLYILILAGFVSAESIGTQVFIETAVAGETAMSVENEYDVLGGQTVNISLVIYGIRNSSVDVRADFFQDASGILRTIMKNIQVASELDFTKNIFIKTNFPLEIPSVERKSVFRLRYYFKTDDKWIPAGTALLNVYPKDILKPIQLFSKKNAILLFGENPALSVFLKSEEIKFEDRKDIFPKKTEEHSLILSAFIDREWYKIPEQLNRNQVLVVFYQEFKGMPRIIIKQAGEGILMEVKLPVLENLNNPKTQETLLEIFDIAGNYLLENSEKISN